MIKNIFFRIHCVLRALGFIYLTIFIFDYFRLFKKKYLVYKTKIGDSILTRVGTSDAGEMVMIYCDEEYPKKFFPKNKNPIILDIGANIGCFTTYISNVLKNQNPKIYSIEPEEENFKILLENIKKNKLKFVKYFKLAVGGAWGGVYK